MTRTFHAVFENGVLRPTEKIDLPERRELEIEVREIKAETKTPSLEDVYDILSDGVDCGEPDLAARHNEHQP